MNDFERANNMIGNRFEMVLIASERMREIHRERKSFYQENVPTIELFKKMPVPAIQAISDIESGKVTRQYLEKVKDRINSKPKFR